MTDVLIQWIDNKQTVYDAQDLRNLRKSAGGMGFLYYNPNSGRYEQVRRIEPISDELRQRASAIRSASISRKSRREEDANKKQELPTHLRLHRIYGV